MRNRSLSVCRNTLLFQRVIGNILLSSALVAGIPLFAQVNFIAADNLTPFDARDVGTTSEAKTVRIQLTFARALTSIGIAPGFTEFTAGAVSGCVVDGHTINPALSACSLEVTFSPKYPGLRTAPLVATDSMGKKASVGLVGTGLAPQAGLTPGIITTIAGNGTEGFSGDGGPATAAEFNEPRYMASDAAGNIYISDTGNYRIRKVDRNGIVTTVAGNGKESYSGDGGPATSAGINAPYGIALDAAGNLYIPEGDSRVRKVDLNGIITTIAGHGSYGNSGDGGPATSALLGCPVNVIVDAAGDIYFSDACEWVVRKVDTHGIISTVAGNGNEYGPLGDGGPATEAALDGPRQLAVDAAGNLYIADYYAERIRKVDINGIITTFAGTGDYSFNGDGGPANKAALNAPNGVVVDAAGNVYISDYNNFRIRRVDTNGTITTIAGNGTYFYAGDGGPVTSTEILSESAGIDASGAFYILDDYSNRVRRVDVSQSAVNFASQNVGIVSPGQQVTVSNTGNQHIEFTDLSLKGDFGQLTGTARDCTDTTFLGAGFSCALRFTFAPTAAGTLTGSATVTDNSLNLPGTTQTILLSGTGVNP
jgi:sugar lactone lactonase YvrE